MTIIMNPKREKAKEDNNKDQDQKLLTTKRTHTCSQQWVMTLSLRPTKSKRAHEDVPHVLGIKTRVKNCCWLLKGWEGRRWKNTIMNSDNWTPSLTMNTYNTCITNQEHKNKDKEGKEEDNYCWMWRQKHHTKTQYPHGSSINWCLEFLGWYLECLYHHRLVSPFLSTYLGH